MRQVILAHGLWVLGFAVACGDGGGSGGPAAGNDPHGTNSGGAAVTGSAGVTGGGAAARCMWAGSGWFCPGSSGALAPGGTGSAGGPTSGSAGGPTSGSAGSNGGGSGGTTGAMSGDGPAITFTEFNINMPSQPGQIIAGKDGNLWFNHQSTKPSAISKMTPGGAFNQYLTQITNIGPVGIAAGPDGNVWYTKQQGVGFASPGGQITERGVPGGRDSAGITAGPDGNLWFT